MAANSVLITKLIGNAWVRGADGNLRALREGMQIPADAQIITASGSTVELQADGQPPLIIGENQNVTFTADLLNPPSPQEASIAQPAPSEIDQIIAAINSGKDPFADLEATAATLSGGSEGGSTFVRLSSIVEFTSPLGLAYPRPGSLPVEEPRLNGAQLSEDEEPGSATVTPNTGTGDDDAGKVYERGLLNGDATKTTIGSVTVSATDGIKDVTIGNATHTVSEAGHARAGQGRAGRPCEAGRSALACARHDQHLDGQHRRWRGAARQGYSGHRSIRRFLADGSADQSA